MSGIIFDPEDVAEDLEPGVKPEGEGEGEEDDDKKPDAPSFSDFRVPDDYEDESLRGLDGQSLIQALKQSKELTKRAIEQANSASGAATAAATAAVAAAGTKTADVPAPTEITKEDLLLADPAIINQKISDIFAEKARPVLIEQYNKMSHQALALAKTNKKSMPWWDDYEDEIITEANKLPVNMTASLDTWVGLYGTVTARHHEEIIDKEIEKREKKSKSNAEEDGAGTKDVTGDKSTDLTGRRVTVVDAGERGKGGGGGGKRALPKLDDDQRRTARLLGVAEEDYAKYAITGEEE